MDKLYTCSEIAKKYTVTVRTVYDWIKSGKMSAFKIGKSFRVSESSLKAFEQKITAE